MLKLSTTSMQAKAKTVVGCSEEALVESIEALSAASESLFSACADAEEVSTVLANLDMCARAVKEGGLTKTVVAAFNSEGELSSCVGQECLTIAGLEALNAEQVKTLSATYSAGLEGKMAEYWNKFVAMLKNIWSKVMNWFKQLFTNRARFVKRLNSYQLTNSIKFNDDKKVVTIPLDTIEKMITLASEIATSVDAFARKTGTAESIPTEFASKKEEAEQLMGVQASEATLKSIGDAAKLSSVRGKYVTQASDKKIMNAQSQINSAFKLLVDEAGKAGSLEGEAATAKKTEVNKKREMLNAAIAACRLENALLMKAGSALDKLFKAATTQDAKATKEPVKKVEEPAKK